jgi:DNA mismatch repair protein MutS2
MNQPRFAEGDAVFVTKLGKVGLVIEVLTHGRYRVAISSVTTICDGSEITASSARPKPKAEIPAHLQPRKTIPPSTIDLHGLTVDEATRKLEVWLSEVIMAGLHQAKVIHGLGSGRLQVATHALLRKVPTVRAFKVSDFNPGETDVYL